MHQRDLDGRWHGLFFVLQPVTRADFDEFDLDREGHIDRFKLNQAQGSARHWFS